MAVAGGGAGARGINDVHDEAPHGDVRGPTGVSEAPKKRTAICGHGDGNGYGRGGRAVVAFLGAAAAAAAAARTAAAATAAAARPLALAAFTAFATSLPCCTHITT